MQIWTCATCGKKHKGLPEGYGFDAPFYWDTDIAKGKHGDSFLSEDYSVIEKRDYFIRGCLEIPIIGRKEPFIWGVWTSLSKSNFDREIRLAKVSERTAEPPYFGWLSNRIQIYPDTIHLKTHVHTRKVGSRPYVELEPTDHPLSVEQRNGITLDRLIDIAEKMEHGWKHPDWNKKPA